MRNARLAGSLLVMIIVDAIIVTSCTKMLWETGSVTETSVRPVMNATWGVVTAGIWSSDTTAAVKRGMAQFETQRCLACHRIKGRGGVMAPDLWGVADRRSAEWILRHFQAPQEVTPGTVMPRFLLSDSDFRDLTAYLLTLRDRP